MSILKIKDSDGNWQSIKTVQGDKGDTGFSPAVSVAVNSDEVYKLKIETETGTITTPNLKATAGDTSTSGSGIVGVIDQYKDFPGKNVPSVNTMQPLNCFSYGTRYVFEREVVMYVYNGDIDKNNNLDINQYSKYQGKEIYVPTTYDGFLTDYLIYNPIPKKETDDWEDPNIVNILPYYGNVKKVNDHVSDENALYNFYKLYPNGSSCTPGTAILDYTVKYDNVQKKIIVNKDSWGEGYSKTGHGVYKVRNKIPMIDKDKLSYKKNDGDDIYYDLFDSTYKGFRSTDGIYRKALDDTLDQEHIENSCTYNTDLFGKDDSKISYGCDQVAHLAKKDYSAPEYDMTLTGTVDFASRYGVTSCAPLMYVALKSETYYTIECLSGDVGVCPGMRGNDIVTPVKSIMYKTTINNDNSVTVDTTKTPDGTYDILDAVTAPKKLVKKGESYTFKLDNGQWTGAVLGCWNAEDYENVKIVEGTIPYSELIQERVASGLTRFKIKAYIPHEITQTSEDELKAEYNIKLYANTDENSYCRFLTNKTINHVNMTDVSMTDHTHTANQITDLQTVLDEQIPKITVSTEELTPGKSPLASGEFYFVYEDEV